MSDTRNDVTTKDRTAPCSEAEEQILSSERTTDRMFDGSEESDARLPADLRSVLGRFVDEESIDRKDDVNFPAYSGIQRRTFLSGLAGGTVMLAGCASDPFSTNSTTVSNPTGMATVRPLDEPIIQHGLTTGSGQYLYARMFQPGDTPSVTDQPNAEQYAEAVDDISEGEFAIFTNIRTAAAVPAYFWPAETEWRSGRLKITLERQTGSYDGAGDEVVGVALTRFHYEGDMPTDADIIFPSGAIISVGQANR